MGELKKALITGASSGIGEAITRKLLEMGYEVYGVGRSFSERGELSCSDDECGECSECGELFGELFGGEASFQSSFNSSFHPIECDLLATGEPERLAADFKKMEIDVLINNAGCAYYGPHEEISPEHLREMLRLNLEVPVILTGQLLRGLKKSGGTIINISSVTALSDSNTYGAAYGASKAALLSFSRSIFDEGRKHGLRVTTIMPDMTDTNLYRNADFGVDTEERKSYLDKEDVAAAVQYVLSQNEGVVVPEIVLKPQLHRVKRKSK